MPAGRREWFFTTRKSAEACLRRHIASMQPMGHEEIGRIFGISRQAVQQEEQKALRKLRQSPELRELFRELAEG
jgi:DNA-directed RNA polymerase sigma subunit (sigma70/sigma32)